MNNTNTAPCALLSPATIDKINIIAATMLRHSNLSKTDKDDIVQEMKIALIDAERRFDPEKGELNTFVIVLVIDNVIIYLPRIELPFCQKV